jgi:polyisoprenoid-binding protein YceI
MRSLLVPALLAFALAGCANTPADPPDPRGVREAGPAPAPDGDRYVIDPAASRITAQIGRAGLLSSFGHDHTIAFREFRGELRARSGALGRSSLGLTVQAASLAEVAKGFSESERSEIERDARDKALEVSKYPEIVYQSARVSATDDESRVEIRGELTLHGVTRPLSIPARIVLEGRTLRASGEVTLRHSDYKIERLSAAGGTVKASEEIRLSFEIVARKAS